MTLGANDITFGYARGADALRGVSVEIEPGAVTAVVGPNASGKTTLLRLLLGAARARSGGVSLDGRPLESIPSGERARRLAYVAQRPLVAAAFTVEEVVRLGRHALGGGESPVRRALERCGLSEHARASHHELSVGQQQRVAIARALAQLDPWSAALAPASAAPRYLLADEPTSAMDPKHAVATIDLLRELAALGLGVCVALHDLTAAKRVADRALALDGEGRVAALGPADEVLAPPVLSRVFGIGFEQIAGSGGAVLIPVAGTEGRRA